MSKILPLLLSFFALHAFASDIVDVHSIDPSIRVEAAYATDWNFIGKPINGYLANKCFLSRQAARALKAVQKDVQKRGYSLLAFDCYRPQRSVHQFVTWTQDTSDSKMKPHFYPEENKSELIDRGYIADRSGHSRASTIDLTLVRINKYDSKSFLENAKKVTDCRQSAGVEATGQLDMGTTFDCFSELAHTANPAVSAAAQKNRGILKSAMEKHGFANYPKEWWHFTLKNEPYKNESFDFEVE